MTTLTEKTEISLPSAGDRRNRLRLIVGAAAAAAVFIGLYAIWPYQHGHFDERISVLKGLYLLVRSPAGSEWIFCLFVPPIAALLVYIRRDSFRGVAIEGSNWGILLLSFSLVIYWLGYRADSRYMGFASAQLTVAALIIWLLGWNYMRLLFFPWLFFAFAWPFLPLEEMLAFPLRIFAARSSVFLLNVLGIDCVREGTALVSLADQTHGYQRGELFQLDVDDPCSGIRSLFSLIMISVFYGYISLARVWQRTVLFAAAVPLAVAGNIVRMLLLAYGCVFFGTEFAVGTDHPSTYHEMSGFAVFVVALFGMFSLSRILESRNPFRKKKKKKEPAASGSASGETSHYLPYWRSAGAAGLALGFLFLCYITPAATGLSAPGLKPALPASIDQYWGQTLPHSKGEKEQLIDAGVTLDRVQYQDSTGRSATATVVIGAPEGRTLHRPEVCLPGQGWKITDSERTTLELGMTSRVTATLLTLVRSETAADGTVLRRKAFNIYWYVGRDRTAATYNRHISLSLFDGMIRNLYHRWGMVSIFSFMPFNEAEDPMAEGETIAVMKDVAQKVIPYVKDGPWAE